MEISLIAETKEYLCYHSLIMSCGTNCYIVLEKAGKQAAIIDPGSEAEALIAAITKLEAQPVVIINTHGHWDHTGANKPLQQHYGLAIAVHAGDAPMLDSAFKSGAILFAGNGDGGKIERLLQEGDLIELGALKIEVLHTPGHTPGGICLKLDKLLFTGDTLFNLSIGRTDFPGGDYEAMLRSLERLTALPDELLVLPGHSELSNLGYEKKHNPYLRA